MNARMAILLATPLIIASVWGALALVTIVLGMELQFSQYIMPLSAVLLIVYAICAYTIYRTEHLEYGRRIDIMDMDMSSLLGRVEMLEGIVRDLKEGKR